MSLPLQQIMVIGGTMSGVAIHDMPAPVNPNDAATKSYVDTAAPTPTPITNSLGADVAISTSVYTDGPSIAQGSTGTWWVSGTVSFTDTGGGSTFSLKLWDGTTVIASAVQVNSSAGFQMSASLSGYISSPAGNLRISAKGNGTAGSTYKFNASGNSKDCTISAFRIA